ALGSQLAEMDFREKKEAVDKSSTTTTGRTTRRTSTSYIREKNISRPDVLPTFLANSNTSQFFMSSMQETHILCSADPASRHDYPS
ncbi:MAG: hypothetical protein ACFFB3_11440, partial [Candidatus Hodarchaeota archaeon]